MLNKGSAPERNPLVWISTEYGGQAAVRIGDIKVLRRNLKTPKPGGWEAYDLSKDIGEKNNLASARPDLVAQAVEVFKKANRPNPNFPVTIPGID